MREQEDNSGGNEETRLFYCLFTHAPVAKRASGPVKCEICNNIMVEIGWMAND